MAEPASTATTVAIAVATGSGFAALVTSTIGIEPRPIFWALIGATLGLSLAKPTGRLYAVASFVCVVFASGLAGTWLSNHFLGGNEIARDLLSLAVAGMFHPLFGVAAALAPGALRSLAQRFGLVPPSSDQPGPGGAP